MAAPLGHTQAVIRGSRLRLFAADSLGGGEAAFTLAGQSGGLLLAYRF